MKSNFTFIKNDFPEIYNESTEAEKLSLTSSKACAILCRSSLEIAVRWLYTNDPDLTEPYDTTLNALMHEYCFRNILKPNMFNEINRVSQFESITSIKYLFRFISFLAIYYSPQEPEIPDFDETILPDGKEVDKTKDDIQKLEQELEKLKVTARKGHEELEKQASENSDLKTRLEQQGYELKERREERAKVVDEEKAIPLLISEQQTRKLYIDLSLKESGWDNLKAGKELEYEVKGMPESTNPSGLGYADYVLWGDNGLPLAVIEAKKTMADSRKGRHQAELYADCLEQMYGQRPILFYTNGFDTHIWDDQFYADREVHGFYTKDELQLLIDRRNDRIDLRTFKVNKDIAG